MNYTLRERLAGYCGKLYETNKPRMKTIDDLISDVEKINKNENVSLPYNLHEFLHRLEEIRAMQAFETFLRQYRRSV